MTCVPAGVFPSSGIHKQVLPSLAVVPGRQEPGGGVDGVGSEAA